MTPTPSVSRTVSHLNVAEIFGPTIQGEGATAGRISHFIRLSGCNLSCSWCDTPYTWDWTGQNGQAYDRKVESARLSIDEIVDAVAGATNVVVTGGEPLTQSAGVVELLKRLDALGISTEVETNGTRPCPKDAPASTRWNVSPKLLSSGNFKRGIKMTALLTFPLDRTIFKFVITEWDDFDEIEALDLPKPNIYVMPEGRTIPEVMAGAGRIAEEAINRGMNFTHRLHLLLWGSERGR